MVLALSTGKHTTMVTYDFDVDSGLLVVKATGVVTAELIGQESVLIDTDSNYEGLRAVILDIGDVDDIDLDAESVKKLASFLHQGTYTQVDRVCVVASRTFHFGLCRMLATYAAMVDVHVEVFRTLEEAKAWTRKDQRVSA